ncbi:MAG: SDR family oxidoreductase [Acidobacteria bacterium]|nr:SDR family oxidoreductase [Acidobacteriota bacterium]
MATSGWSVEQIPAQDGKTMVVTGANSGIGFQAALELARHGAHVLLGCRDAAKGQAALERLTREVPGAKAEVAALDMASLASIRAFAAEFAQRGIALDVLINNAGVMALPRRELTVDGFERQFGTNHLGHFALTGLLMPQLLQAMAPRVVTVASLAHRNGKIDFANLQSEREYKPWGAYGESKLANILFARELERRAKAAGSRLISVPVHPGVSQTSIVANGPGASDLKTRVLFTFARFLTSKDAEGAWPTLFAATSTSVRGGQYIGPSGFMEFKGTPTVVQPRPNGLDEKVGERLWVVSEELTGVHYPPLG